MRDWGKSVHADSRVGSSLYDVVLVPPRPHFEKPQPPQAEEHCRRLYSSRKALHCASSCAACRSRPSGNDALLHWCYSADEIHNHCWWRTILKSTRPCELLQGTNTLHHCANGIRRTLPCPVFVVKPTIAPVLDEKSIVARPTCTDCDAGLAQE